MIPENQPVVFAKQSVIFISSYLKPKHNRFKWDKDKKINTKSFILVHSLPNNRLNWLDNKVNQFQAFSNSLKNMKCKTTSWNNNSIGWFLTFFRKHIFSRELEIKQPWIITMSGLTNSNYAKHIHKSSSRVFKQFTWVWRHQSLCSTIRPTKDKQKPN